MRKRRPGEIVEEDGELRLVDDRSIGPLEWQLRWERSLGWLTAKELAVYLDRSGVRIED